MHLFGPVDDSKSRVKNDAIEYFNQKLQSGLSSNVKFLDVYNLIKNSEFKTDVERASL